MRYQLVPIESPRLYAVDEIDSRGRHRRIKVFEDRREAVKLVGRLNNRETP